MAVEVDALLHGFVYTKHHLIGEKRKYRHRENASTSIDDVIGIHQEDKQLQLRAYHYPLSKKLYRKRHETVLTFNDIQSLLMCKSLLAKAIDYYPKKYLIILNPYGGAKLASNYLKNVVEPMFFEAGIKFDVVATKYKGHAKTIAKNFDRNKYDGIVTISGDGTLHEIINGISERTDGIAISDIPIGILNGGTANCLVAAILQKRGERRCNEKRAIWNATFALIKGKARLIDTMVIENAAKSSTDCNENQKVFLCQSISWGLICDVEFESEWLRTFGSQRYTAYAIKHMLLNKTHEGTIHYEPELLENITSSLFKQYLSNNPRAYERHQRDSRNEWKTLEKRTFSFVALMVNGFWSLDNIASPFSELDDGSGYIMLVPKPVSSRVLLKIFLNLETGNHAYYPEVEWICVRKIKFEFPSPKQLNYDGEQAFSDYLQCCILPQSTKIIC